MTENVYTALASAQIEMGSITKGATNPAFRSKYADLADVASVVIPALASKGVAVFHYIKPAEGRDYMRTEFVHGATATRIWCDVPLIVDKANMQGYKSATTYAKRIGLESLSGVAPEDDDGNAAASAPPRHQNARRQEPASYTPAGQPAPADMAINSLMNADTVDQLKAIWGGLGKPLQALPEVLGAKENRKAQLEPPAQTTAQTTADVLGDDIPEGLK